MSIPLTNYSSQIAQLKNSAIKAKYSNSVRRTHLILMSSTSASTMMDVEHDGEMSTQLPTPPLANPSTSLRSLLKTGGLFNTDMESSDNLNELFEGGNEFTLHRLLSDLGSNDVNIDMNDVVKFDLTKSIDARLLSEFLQCGGFDQMGPSITDSIDEQSSQFDSVPSAALTCSAGSYTELCPLTPELAPNEVFHLDANELKLELEQPLIYTELNSLEDLAYTPSTTTSISSQFNFDPSALAHFEHNYSFREQPTTMVDTPSPSPIVSTRTPTRTPRRTSSRLQSRAALNFNDLLNDSSCSSPAFSESSSISSRRMKRTHSVNRAVDIKNADDLSYYLERRRKNNEASKMSRATRKQKFDSMDARCADYQRANAELRLKLSTLETVTTSLKNGLIHSFQRK